MGLGKVINNIKRKEWGLEYTHSRGKGISRRKHSLYKGAHEYGGSRVPCM